MIINPWIVIFNLLEALKAKPTMMIFSNGVTNIIDIRLRVTFCMIENPYPKTVVIDNKTHYLKK